MQMPQLTFNQKVGLGFVMILSMLAASGLGSIWNLYGISQSNTRVSESAVPVVRVANQVQIQLLKLANVSALSFNALTEEEIKPYQDDFRDDAALFDEAFSNLEVLAEHDKAMQQSVSEIKSYYQNYRQAVSVMLETKLAVLSTRSKVDRAAEELTFLSDDVGAALINILDYQDAPAKFEKEMKHAQGVANYTDGLQSGFAKTVEEVRVTLDPDRLGSAAEDFRFPLDEVSRQIDIIKMDIEAFDEDGLAKAASDALTALQTKLQQTPGIVEFKTEELEQRALAQQKFDESKVEVGKAVKGLDDLLKSADTTFMNLQEELGNSLSFGFKSAIGITILLLLLATQNFNSMRNAIRKKMIDLAKLNQIGGMLAAARDQGSALDQVLQAMSEKIGVENGSVFLFNDNQELEARAFLPPRQVAEDKRAITFNVGEGILGKAAEQRKSIFVPDTSREPSFVSGPNDKPRALLCVPLLDKDILIGAMNFSGDVKNVAFADSDYEFVSSVAQSLVTTIKNIRMVEVIEEHNRDLEKKVADRTAALKQKNDDIANMLSNMHQGLFTIVEGGLIHPEYAAYLEAIFETTHISNRNFADLLFRNCKLSQDVLDSALTSVASIVGEDIMMYEFNAHLLVKELTLNFEDKPDKLIELDWDPIKDENDVVTKLMVTVRDVTELKKLQAEAEGQKQELTIIGEILAVDAAKFSDFIRGALKFVAECRKIIQTTPNKNLERVADLFRNMHTVKGNARTYGFKLITETVHLVENTYDQLRKNEEMEWQPSTLLYELATAEAAIRRYDVTAREKLARDGKSGGAALDREQVAQLLDNVIKLSSLDLPARAVPLVKDTYRKLLSIESKPVSKVIAPVVESVKSLAVELGKTEPAVQIADGDVFIHSDVHGMMGDIFMHIMRNAIDHGIESPAERVEKRKADFGTIVVNTDMVDGNLVLDVRDDGRGLALTRIFRKAVEMGLYAPDAKRPAAIEVANLIFASGFSTAEQVTEVSGRGVGMEAVKQFLLAEGGSISVMLDDGDEMADFRGFTTRLRLPAKFFTVAPPLALSA
jgi:two-component system chemotaxis sensor kinase CheA